MYLTARLCDFISKSIQYTPQGFDDKSVGIAYAKMLQHIHEGAAYIYIYVCFLRACGRSDSDACTTDTHTSGVQ